MRAVFKINLLASRVQLIAGLGLLVLISGCGGGNDGGSVCADFKYQEDAQAAFRNGAKQLDGDNDGIACENLPRR